MLLVLQNDTGAISLAKLDDMARCGIVRRDGPPSRKGEMRLVLQFFFRRRAMLHLTKQERCKIENFLLAGVMPQEIARNIGRSHTTINRELQRHRIEKEPDHRKNTNYCVFSRKCNKYKVYNLPPSSCLRKCSRCRMAT